MAKECVSGDATWEKYTLNNCLFDSKQAVSQQSIHCAVYYLATCHLDDLQMDDFWYLLPHTSHTIYFLLFLFYNNLIDPSPFENNNFCKQNVPEYM